MEICCWQCSQKNDGTWDGMVKKSGAECGASMEDRDDIREMKGLGLNLCVAPSPKNKGVLNLGKQGRQRWVVFCKGKQQLQAREVGTNQGDFYTTGVGVIW